MHIYHAIINLTFGGIMVDYNKKYLLKKLAIYYLYSSITINSFFNHEITNTSDINIISCFDNMVNFNINGYKLPKLNTYIPQGLTLVNDNIYITAYDGKMKKNSVIFEIHNDNSSKIITLDTNAHVGGITYDEVNHLFWICDIDGTISSYKYDDVITKNNIYAETKNLNVNNNDLINHKGSFSVAYITFYDNHLYVGNYSKNNSGILKSYKVKNNGSIDLSSVKIYKTPNKVQGVTFYKDTNTTYILFSISYGAINYSKLKIDIFDERKIDYRNIQFLEYYMPRMMEEIIVSNDDKFMALFESNAYKYKTGILDMNKIYETDIKRLIKKD